MIFPKFYFFTLSALEIIGVACANLRKPHLEIHVDNHYLTFCFYIKEKPTFINIHRQDLKDTSLYRLVSF